MSHLPAQKCYSELKSGRKRNFGRAMSAPDLILGTGMNKKSSKARLIGPAANEQKGVSLEIARRQIKDLIANEAGAMVVEAIKKAKKGQYQVMKYLFEVAGLYPAIAPQAAHDDLSLARELCDQLGLPETDDDELGGNEYGIGESRTNGHALK
jgi:hypothetical protein